jgi:DNA processing protein
VNPDPGLASWLQLALTPGLGPATFQRILRQFGLPQAILAKKRAELASFVTPAVLAALDSEAVGQAVARSLAWAGQPGCSIVTLADEAYPRLLLEIPDPPALL